MKQDLEPMTGDDLERMALALRKRKRDRKMIGWIGLGLFVASVGLIGVALAVRSGMSAAWRTKMYAYLILGALPGLGLLIAAAFMGRKLQRDLAERQVLVVEGTIEEKQERRSRNASTYRIRVAGSWWAVEVTWYTRFIEGERVRLRCAPHSRHILYVEALG